MPDRPADLPSAHSLWRQAHDEHPDDYEAGEVRYGELLREHGLIVKREATERPTYEQLEACVASLRRDLDWAIGLLREVQSTRPAWEEGVGEFLDAIDAEEATDG